MEQTKHTVHIGPQGGKYIIINNKKKYLKSKNTVIQKEPLRKSDLTFNIQKAKFNDGTEASFMLNQKFELIDLNNMKGLKAKYLNFVIFPESTTIILPTTKDKKPYQEIQVKGTVSQVFEKIYNFYHNTKASEQELKKAREDWRTIKGDKIIDLMDDLVIFDGFKKSKKSYVLLLDDF